MTRIKEQREVALSKFENPISAIVELSETLSQKMDFLGLLRFIVDVQEM
jgi:hypothetical protein